MRTEWNTIRKFNTARFAVELAWAWENDSDLSWDKTGETQRNVESGKWGVFTFRVAVYCDGHEIAADYLGNSVYADPAEFGREHIGIRPKSRAAGCNYGCYFPDMLSQAISEARKALCNAPKLRCS